jgi:Phosphotransferase enzyme family
MTGALDVLAGAVQKVHGSAPVHVERQAYSYAMSHRLDEIAVTLEDGRVMKLLWKHLDGMMEGARAAKPAFLYDPRRETRMYEGLLPKASLGTARCYAAGDQWLLLEKVAGVELYQVGDLSLWQAAASWLGRAHRIFTSLLSDGAGGEWVRHLVVHDATLYRLWLERAVCALEDRDDRRWGRALVLRYSEVVDCLLAFPRTVLHGDFYASNVLVAAGRGSTRVCPVDWEMAGLGPGITDLAALVSGGWLDEERADIAASYGGAEPAYLDIARLQLAVQWLGWSPGWEPPEDHAHDWLGEAKTLTEKLSLT